MQHSVFRYPVAVHPCIFFGGVCVGGVWRVRGRGLVLSIVLSATLKLLQAGYRPTPVFRMVSLNILPNMVKDINDPRRLSLSALALGEFPAQLAGADALGFAGFHGRLLRDMKSP